MQRTVTAERCWGAQLLLHSDNGAPMKYRRSGQASQLGVTPSRGRPRVSNDNPCSESLFRTLNYCPRWPSQGFGDIYAARCGCSMSRMYNKDHRDSRIRFFTPAQRHPVKIKIYWQSCAEYQAARPAHPERWSGETRNWSPIGAVMLNPERPEIECRKAA